MPPACRSSLAWPLKHTTRRRFPASSARAGPPPGRSASRSRSSWTAAQQRLTTLESDLVLARNPGLTTVILQPSKDSNGAWASAVWGEMAGKGFLEVRAYGLKPAGEGKAYQAWFQAGEEKPVLVGVLDPGPNGAGFAMGKELPAAAKGGRVLDRKSVV